MFDKNSKQGTFFLNLFLLVMVVDKLEIFKDVHENNDIKLTQITRTWSLHPTILRQSLKHLKKRMTSLLCETVIKSLEEYGEELSLDP